jgi:uncharacterized peroxidase-related enzyme
MAYIEVIHPEQAEGNLAEIFQKVRGPGGQVDNVLQIHSLRPHTLLGHMGLYTAVLHHPGNRLPRWFLESMGVLVSLLNGCGYCVRHHSAGLKRLLSAKPERCEALLAQLHSALPGPPFDPAQLEALAYVRKLTLTPSTVAQEDIELLRTRGFDDGEILEINQVASYFAYANRTVAGLGVSTAGEQLGFSPVDSSDPDNWKHG